MRILITVRSGERGILVRLPTRRLEKRVRSLVAASRRSHAIAAALAGGLFEEEVFPDTAPSHAADLILSEDRASWTIAA